MTYIKAAPIFGHFPIIPGGEFGADRRWVGAPSPPLHTGVDHATPIGTSVPAMTRGRVLRAGWFDALSGYGVKIQREDGSTLSHFHLDRVVVQAGDWVERDQLVAHSGNTGSATTGPHLHTEYRDATGVPRDPLIVLRGDNVDRETYAREVEPLVKDTIRAMLEQDLASQEKVGAIAVRAMQGVEGRATRQTMDEIANRLARRP